MENQMSIYGNSHEDRFFQAELNKYLDSLEPDIELSIKEKIDSIIDWHNCTQNIAISALAMFSGDLDATDSMLTISAQSELQRLYEHVALISDNANKEELHFCELGDLINE